jgi:hypothetical protein
MGESTPALTTVTVDLGDRSYPCTSVMARSRASTGLLGEARTIALVSQDGIPNLVNRGGSR